MLVLCHLSDQDLILLTEIALPLPLGVSLDIWLVLGLLSWLLLCSPRSMAAFCEVC